MHDLTLPDLDALEAKAFLARKVHLSPPVAIALIALAREAVELRTLLAETRQELKEEHAGSDLCVDAERFAEWP